MRHKVDTFKIGRSSAHRKAMLANMVSSLIEHGEIRTTLRKAKEARRLTEKMITRGLKGDLHSRRLVIAKLRNKDAVKHLFEEVAPRYADRNGGYTRIIKLGARRGDAADMCILQLVEGTVAKNKTKKAAAPAKEEASVKEDVPVVENAEVIEEKA